MVERKPHDQQHAAMTKITNKTQMEAYQGISGSLCLCSMSSSLDSSRCRKRPSPNGSVPT